jgi:hypothetical protein
MCTRPNPTDTMPAVQMGLPTAYLSDAVNALEAIFNTGVTDTTTLSLKNELQGQGFFCTQQMASYFLEKVYDERQGTPDELARTHNGRHFVYSVAADPNGTTSNSIAALLHSVNTGSGPAITAPASQRNTSPIATDATTVDLTQVDQDHWLTYHVKAANGKPAGGAVYDKGLSREQARVQYANQVGKNYNDVRACRVANA